MTRLTIATIALLTGAACNRTDDDAKRATAIAKTTEEAKATVAAISAAYNAHDAARVASFDAPCRIPHRLTSDTMMRGTVSDS